MELLVSTSIVSAFVAGVAALFAPCCITVLLPSYLASIFRERRMVFLMTFIFFLGILTVFLPLGLGSAVFGQLLSRYHRLIFTIGGSFLLLLGLSMVLGMSFSLPFHVNPVLKNRHPFSVYTLGIFSGIATTCCAPVLAGVLALAALPGSVFLGGAYTLSYVLGMVMPLFLLAFILDKTRMTEKFMVFRKTLSYSFGKRSVRLTVGEAVSGLIFLGMGALTIALALNQRLAVHSEYQLTINIMLTRFINGIKGFVNLLPEYVWAILALLFLLGITWRVIYLVKKEQHYEEKS